MRWRATRDPYRILVSELMLQQTQVERVRGKYAAFVRRFPDVRTLAAAPLSDVLRLWSGLGYNRRAKYLRDCAREVLERHGGKFPRERDALLTLPGVGPSTASALRAFAFGEDDPMIDTNLRRVLRRVFFARGAAPRDSELYTLARALIPAGKGREWNYAMLDVAATVCLARDHKDDCPFARWHGPVRNTNTPRTPRVVFQKTRRFARGRVLAVVGAFRDGVTLREVQHVLKNTDFSAHEILCGLIQDGLVQKRDGKFFLPDV